MECFVVVRYRTAAVDRPTALIQALPGLLAPVFNIEKSGVAVKTEHIEREDISTKDLTVAITAMVPDQMMLPTHERLTQAVERIAEHKPRKMSCVATDSFGPEARDYKIGVLVLTSPGIYYQC